MGWLSYAIGEGIRQGFAELKKQHGFDRDLRSVKKQAARILKAQPWELEGKPEAIALATMVHQLFSRYEFTWRRSE